MGKPKVLSKIAASITTATTAVLLFQPMEVVKVRMQAGGASSPYSGALNAYATIGREEGFRGLWRGVSPNVARLSVVNCTEIVVYDIIKSWILYKNLMTDGVPCHFASALSAGFVTTIIASPITSSRQDTPTLASVNTGIHSTVPSSCSNRMDQALSTRASFLPSLDWECGTSPSSYHTN